MGQLKDHFLLNGKTYDELEKSEKLKMDRMFSLLQGIEPFLEKGKGFEIWTNRQGFHRTFNSNLPQQLTPKIMEAISLSDI